jgi:hypothetical protein
VLTFTPPPTPIVGPTTTGAIPPVPSPLATSTRGVLYLATAADFGADRNPLTGELAADPALLDRRPLAVKISNAPAQWVRPQSGLNDADLIFEHVTEGALTRFTMIVYGKTPADLGPIRSARPIDLELPAMYDAALVYSGSSEGVRQKLLVADFRPRILFSNEPGYYRTGANKPFEHTLYGKPELFWQSLEASGQNTRPAFQTYMAFGDVPPAGGQPAGHITVTYRSTVVDWQYDPATGRYLRWADGQPHLDGNTNEQVQAANVIVLYANHVNDPNICEQITNGVCVALAVEAQIWGSGPVTIFRDGQRYEGTWERIGRHDMFTFKDAAGQPIPLQIGNTWFQTMPLDYVNPVAVTP